MDEQRENGLLHSDYVRRLMQPRECKESHRLFETEDWNLTFAKFKRLSEVFPDSIFVTVKKNTQEVVAVVSAIPTFPDQYIVGNLVVRPDHQSRGLGKSMLRYLLDNIRLFGSITATLTAVPGTTQFYSKMGFKEIGPDHHVNYVIADRCAVQQALSEHNTTNDVVVSKYTPDMFQALNEYDTRARGYDCGKYLSVMTDCSDIFLLATSTISDQVVGYAAAADEPTLLLVDGVYADSDGIALQLYSSLLDECPGKQEMKIQEIKPRNFLSQFGERLPKCHQYTRMAIGPTPSVPACLDKLYVVCDCDYSE